MMSDSNSVHSNIYLLLIIMWNIDRKPHLSDKQLLNLLYSTVPQYPKYRYHTYTTYNKVDLLVIGYNNTTYAKYIWFHTSVRLQSSRIPTLDVACTMKTVGPIPNTNY